MKNCLLIIFMTIGFISYSQTNNIILKSGEVLDVKITEIGNDNVKYKKTDFLEGPNYVLSNSDIFMIKFSNGDKKIFENKAEKDNVIYSNIEDGVIVQLYTARTYTSKNLQVGSMIELRTKESMM